MYKVGEKTIVRKLKREDIDKMMLWGKHDNPEFLHYNFPYLSKKERDLWYKIKAKYFRRECFAIDDTSGNLVGYISIRNIKFFLRESELGIVFDPDKLNKGYGTDGLDTFLDLYFNTFNMKKIMLKVGKFNKRALKCYKKCGFRIYKELIEEFEEQSLDLIIMKEITKNSEDFQMEAGKLITKYYYMHLTREEYLFHKENKELLITL